MAPSGPTSLFLVLFAQTLVSLTSGDLFPKPQFSGEDVTAKVFQQGENLDVFPVAYGDFNADKLTDVIALTNDRSAVRVFFAYEEAPFLRKGVPCPIRTDKNNSVRVDGAAVGDFTGDGVMDLLITFQQGDGKKKHKEVIIFEGNSSTLICQNRMGDTLEVVQEPLVVDLNGDMIMDLVGETYTDNDFNNHERKRKVWIFKESPNLQPTQLDFIIENEDDHSYMPPMANPSSNAFVDFDGDSVPELVILTQPEVDYSKKGKIAQGAIAFAREIFKVKVPHPGSDQVTFSRVGRPQLVDKKNQTRIIGQPIFVDLNQEGKLLHLVPFCTTLNCKGDVGSEFQGIKVFMDNGTTVDLPIGNGGFDGKQWGFVHPPLSEVNDVGEGFYSRSIVLRMGDYNLDGFPDLIAILKPSLLGGSSLERRAVIFENVPCKDTEKMICKFPRTFSPNFNVLGKYGNVTLATFFDIHEDGLIDVLIVRKYNNDTGLNSGKFEVKAFQNSPDYDSNFMKVMVLTGRKCPKCPKFQIPYGSVIPGPVISYRTTTQSGAMQTAIAAQSYRSAHMTMDLPYTIFGIGHSPNFVETLKIALSDTENRRHEWSQIIPNSQIIVIPYPMEQSRQWKAKLFLTPSDAVLQTFGVLVGICLVVFCIVVGLQVKEVREDRRDRMQEAHRFMM